jgi:hypothetical protein
LAAVKQNAYSIADVKNPSEEVQFAAIQQDKRAYQYI